MLPEGAFFSYFPTYIPAGLRRAGDPFFPHISAPQLLIAK